VKLIQHFLPDEGTSDWLRKWKKIFHWRGFAQAFPTTNAVLHSHIVLFQHIDQVLLSQAVLPFHHHAQEAACKIPKPYTPSVVPQEYMENTQNILK
jgi:hypothetical protein